MDRNLNWSLSPAFDLTYAFDPTGKWTSSQIMLNRKQKDFVREDLIKLALKCNLTRRQADEIIDKTIDAFNHFEGLANEYEVPRELAETINTNLRLHI